MLEKITTATGMFEATQHEVIEIPYEHHGEGGHRFIIENFANAILSGEPLIAPASEGIHSVMLGNAMMLSSFRKQTIEIPIDEDAYEQHLQALTQQSTFQKTERNLDAGSVNVNDSFNT